MIDPELIKTKISSIQNELGELLRFEKLSMREISRSYDTHKIVERTLEIIINEAIDINQHLIAESNLGKLPFDFKESFTLLFDLKVYPKEFGQEIAKSVGLRNILVHQYRKLDEEIFYESIGLCLKQYHQYCKYLLAYLRKI